MIPTPIAALIVLVPIALGDVVALVPDAVGAAARARGLRVPEDIGVAGYDDLDMPVARDVRLTTVHLPLEELGAEAVRRVHWRMGHPSAPPLHWLLETRVVEGDSVVARSA